MSANEAVRWAWDLLEPRLADHGYELVEVEMAQQGGAVVLRLYIDKPGGGITLDDCQAVSRLVRPSMDASTGAVSSFALEVSSPGIERPIRKPHDFERFTGQKVKLKTHRPVDGRKRFTGVLKSYDDGMISVDCDGTVYVIPAADLLKAHLDR